MGDNGATTPWTVCARNEAYGANTWLHDDTTNAFREYLVGIKCSQFGSEIIKNMG